MGIHYEVTPQDLKVGLRSDGWASAVSVVDYNVNYYDRVFSLRPVPLYRDLLSE